jgi:hypothetical protein
MKNWMISVNWKNYWHWMKKILDAKTAIRTSSSSQLENGVITSTDYIIDLNAETQALFSPPPAPDPVSHGEGELQDDFRILDDR